MLTSVAQMNCGKHSYMQRVGEKCIVSLFVGDNWVSV